MSVIEVQNLRKNFGSLEVLRDVSFSVEKGDVVAIIGSSGSGKSTLLRCLIDLETVSGGTIVIDGRTLCRDGAYVSVKEKKAITRARRCSLCPKTAMASARRWRNTACRAAAARASRPCS